MTKIERTVRRSRSRILFVFVLLELCFVLLTCWTFYIQCIRGDELRRQAEAQYRKEVYVNARRGGIYDRNYQPLAVNVSAYSLYAEPLVMEQREPVARSLASILGSPEADILEKLNSDRRFIWLKRKLPDQVVDKIESLGIRGLGFREEERRFYPKGSLAAHVIGFVGVDNVGLEGIEKSCDSYMQGNLQEYESQKDCMGRGLIPLEIGCTDDTSGYDVVLTIDEVIQYIAEVELQKACWKSQAKSGSVIIMNPRTGEILALANYPAYDLNKAFSTNDECKRNRAIRDLYEPGSAFKVVTAAAIINEGLVTVDEKINCENGVYQFNGYTIHDVKGHGLLTFSEVVEQSSNIGTVKAASRLGNRKLYSYIEAFGLTDKTGLELSERTGLIRPLESWTKHSMAAIPFGQEIAITPLQMLCSANAIANNGVMMKPFIVRCIRDGQEIVEEFLPQKSRIPVSPRTAGIMRQILIRSVTNGTGKKAGIYGYEVAGKTGTAQKASGSEGYLPGKYVSSFVGFLSGKGLTISMIVIIDEPQGNEYTGGVLACPVFRDIAIQVMQYLTIGQRSCAVELKPTG